MFKLDKKTNLRLENEGLSYRTSHNAGDSTITAEIVDKRLRNQPIVATATGADEKSAVEAALAKYNPDDRPQTAAEIRKENQELKEKVARLEAEREGRDAPPPADPPNGDPPVDPESATPMTSAEIVAALKARHIEVPEGDRRTGEWRDAALKLIEAHDAE